MDIQTERFKMALGRKELIKEAEKHINIGTECDVLKDDCDIIEFLLDNCEIEIPQGNRFFVKVNCDGISNSISWSRAEKFKCLIEQNDLTDGQNALAYDGIYDFGHTTTEKRY